MKFKVGLCLIIFGAVTFISANVLANMYIADTISGYDDKIAGFEQEIVALNNERKKIDGEISIYSTVLSVKNKLLDYNLEVFSDAEAMEYALVIVEESLAHNIDANMVLAIIQTESSFRTFAVSHKGAMGLMQLLPGTAFYMSKKINSVDIKKKDEIFEVKNNLRLGIAYLSYLVKKTGGLEHAIIAYNYGPTNLKRALNSNKPLPKKYLKTVMNNYKKIAARM